MEEMLKVGVITSSHGVHGEVKVFPTTDDPARFRELKKVLLDTGKERIPLKIQRVKFFKQLVILKFEGIDDINEVLGYRQCPLYVEREDAVPLGEDEYFIADMIGMRVETDGGETLGTLKDVIPTGANDVYVVDSPRYGEVLLPAIHDCILEVDVRAERMRVHLLDGLIEG